MKRKTITLKLEGFPADLNDFATIFARLQHISKKEFIIQAIEEKVDRLIGQYRRVYGKKIDSIIEE